MIKKNKIDYFKQRDLAAYEENDSDDDNLKLDLRPSNQQNNEEIVKAPKSTYFGNFVLMPER